MYVIHNSLGNFLVYCWLITFGDTNSVHALVRLQTSFLSFWLCLTTYPLSWAILRVSSSEALTEVLLPLKYNCAWQWVTTTYCYSHGWADKNKVFWQQASANLYHDIVSAGHWSHLKKWLADDWRADLRLLDIIKSSKRDKSAWVMTLMRRLPLFVQQSLQERLSCKEECCVWESCCTPALLAYI